MLFLLGCVAEIEEAYFKAELLSLIQDRICINRINSMHALPAKEGAHGVLHMVSVFCYTFGDKI